MHKVGEWGINGFLHTSGSPTIRTVLRSVDQMDKLDQGMERNNIESNETNGTSEDQTDLEVLNLCLSGESV